MEKEFVRYDWEKYKEMLERYDYTEEQLEAVRLIRETWDCMTNDQFRFLFLSGVIKRLIKNKKARNYYVNEQGEIFSLNHHLKTFVKAGYFKEE